jgi:hypothetical protein
VKTVGELSDIVISAIPIAIASHTVATLGRAHARYKATQAYYPTKSFIQRLPRCVKRRILSPGTFKYTALLATGATAAYHILRNI